MLRNPKSEKGVGAILEKDPRSWAVLPTPLPVFDEPLVTYGNVSLESVVAVLGPAREDVEQDGNEPGPCICWGFRLKCQLPLFFRFHLAKNFIEVCSDAPELDHVIQHLPFWGTPDWRSDLTDPQTVDRWTRHHTWLEKKGFRPKEWDWTWELWRQDDNGHRELMEKFCWIRDAECTRAAYEARGHKQTYWLAKGPHKDS